MLLIIPSVELQAGKCLLKVRGVDGFTYSDDPVEIARLWRKENSKSLHVTDLDGAREGHLVNTEAIRTMVQCVDIPIELGGGLRTFDEVKKAFDIGVYRVVIGTMLIDNPDEAKRVLDTFGSTKVVLGIDAENGFVKIHGRKMDSGLTAVSLALNAKQLGFKRVIYKDLLLEDTMRGPNFSAIKSFAQATGLKVTASGGIGGLDDLLKMQELEPLGIDSVVVGRALYENKFACQGLWRMCEAGNYPYTAKV
jgi:phosphoribosylformimino-5-aminoimidazole carboxamide ribotide isomerase